MTTDTTTTAGAGPPGTEPGRTNIVKVVFASLIGTAVEWYDFFLYGSAAALVFGTLFFPESEPATGDPAGLRHLRPRLRRPPARRHRLRALR